MLNGGDVSTREWRGKVVLLDYWGTHCPPCVKEFGHFQDLRAEYGDDVVIIAVTDDDQKKVERFVQRHGVTLPVWLDSKAELRDAYRVSSIPALYVLDAEGKVREHFVGLQKPQTLREALQRLGVTPRGDGHWDARVPCEGRSSRLSSRRPTGPVPAAMKGEK